MMVSVTDTPWTFAEESASLISSDDITLVYGASFVIADRRGDLTGRGVSGLYVGDSRTLSTLLLEIDGHRLEPLAVTLPTPSTAQIAARSADRSLLVRRELGVAGALRVDTEVRNLGNETRTVEVTLSAGTDLAGLFAVTEGRVASAALVPFFDDGRLVFADTGGRRGAVVRTDVAGAPAAGGFTWTVELAPRGAWRVCVEVDAVRGGSTVTFGAPSSQRDDEWHALVPKVTSDVEGLAPSIDRAVRDLGALRIVDADHPEDVVVAAGAPWFMTLFGRDSIITAWMAMVLDPQLALSTARVLARLQGRETVPATEEQPGRILHEVRFGDRASLALEDGDVYYGSVDATPLFVMLVDEMRRWGVPMRDLEPLLPAVDAALAWLAGPGDPDGDGFVEYERMGAGGLVNQGWKDSWDGVSFADGRLPEGPIALAEVQGYAYAAWLAGASLAEASGANARAAARRVRADELRVQFNERFWLPDRDAFAIALDGTKHAVDAIASNMGHCLWTGIVDAAKAASVARWLMSPEMATGWGVRTLASSMARFNPLSYHNGSVWPHDTAIGVAGLRRAGFVAEAQQLATALLAASAAHDGRLPELFAGLTREELAVPVSYPASCAPQAWASAAPLLLLRSLLGLEPDVPNGELIVDPALPTGASTLHVDGLPLAGTRISLAADGDAVAVRGLPRGLSVVRPS
jgi:glycogen debranching enzyme